MLILKFSLESNYSVTSLFRYFVIPLFHVLGSLNYELISWVDR